MRRGMTRADYAALESAVLTDRATITARLEANESVRKIAGEYGIDRRTLARIADEWGVRRRPATQRGRAPLSPCKHR